MNLRFAWIFAGLFIVIGLVLTFWKPRQHVQLVPERRVDVAVDVPLETDYGPAIALSPDGSMLAFAGKQLYVRRVTDHESTPLPGTADARSPFFSPDGQWIAFFTSTQLKKIRVAGGEVVTLCNEETARGGTWSPDGTIIYATIHGGLWSVSEKGGASSTLTRLDRDERETTHRWPQSVADGRMVLFTANAGTEWFEDSHAVLQDLRSGRRYVLHRGGYHYRYLPDGRMIYLSQGNMLQVPVDLKRMDVTGPADKVADNVLAFAHNGAAQIAVATSSALVYVLSDVSGEQALDWLEDGKAVKRKPLRSAPDYYYGLAFSPDGNRVAYGLSNGSQFSISIYDWKNDKTSNLTATTGPAAPIWTPDGARVTYATGGNIVWQRADGADVPRVITATGPGKVRVPESWHPSGKYLAFREFSAEHANDVMVMEMKGDEPGEVRPLAASANDELDAAFSPDGTWIAYAANGPDNVYRIYARAFPGDSHDVPFLITPKESGTSPTWSKKGGVLFFRAADGHIKSVKYNRNSREIGYEAPQAISEQISADLGKTRSYDQSPDGRLALLEALPHTDPKKAILVYNLNWSPAR